LSALSVFFAVGWASSIFAFFRGLGGFGVFLLGICDSSFLFIPFGNDLLLIALVSSNRDSWIWVLYVILAALGSVVGVLLVDLVFRKIGEEGLENFVKPERIKKLKSKLETKAGLAVFTATLLPPPFPFTAVVMTASALQTPRKAIVLAVFFGRLLRFTIEAQLAIYFGYRLLEYLNSDVVEYAMYAFIAIAAIGSFISIRKLLQGRRSWSNRAQVAAD
jgi:membrane protein YqaA with SNARE-associated domain